MLRMQMQERGLEVQEQANSGKPTSSVLQRCCPQASQGKDRQLDVGQGGADADDRQRVHQGCR